MKYTCLGLLALLLISSAVKAEESAVGMRKRMEQLVIPGSELEVKPIVVFETPIVIRMIGTYVHGTAFRYDLEYSGLEPGTYNLIDFLQRKDRTPIQNVPAVEVTILSVLPEGQLSLQPQESHFVPKVGGYQTLIKVAIATWVLGFLAIWFLRRQKVSQDTDSEKKLSFEELLRPKIEAAIAGKLDESGHAELERMLLGFWRRRLDLQETEPAEAMAQLRKHDEAGPLLLALEQWLHQPNPSEKVDLAKLLKPYQSIEGDQS